MLRALIVVGVLAASGCGGGAGSSSEGSSGEGSSGTSGSRVPTSGADETGGSSGSSACGFSVKGAAAWPEADALFRRDPRWLGADDAYSVDLGGDRVLWLFADTFIATSAAQVREASKLIRNSVAVQTGADPSTASIEFAWREGDEPTSFFPEAGELWFWPGDGERVGDGLIVFLMAVQKVEGGFGFSVVGSDAVWIADADAPPATWEPVTIASFRAPDQVPGSASVMVEGEFLYALTAVEGGAALLRWPLAEIGADALPAPEVLEPLPVVKDTQVEFTVHRDMERGQYVLIESKGFGGTDLAYRTAPALTGPWSEATVFHRPAESDGPNAFVYAGKGHPELRGGDLVVTYVANSFEFADLFSDPSLYYPRFVRAELGCEE